MAHKKRMWLEEVITLVEAKFFFSKARMELIHITTAKMSCIEGQELRFLDKLPQINATVKERAKSLDQNIAPCKNKRG